MLRKLGEWMKINKEALHGSSPAPFHKGGVDKWKDGTIRYTENDSFLYIIELKKINDKLVIPGIILSKKAKIELLGCGKKINWYQNGSDLVIDKLGGEVPSYYAAAFKIRLEDIIE